MKAGNVRVYSRYLNLLTETNSFQSLQMPRNFSGVSNFEIHINKHLQGSEHFNKGNIIALDGYKAGVILTREISLDESGKGTENIVVSGYTLDGLISRRVTVPPSHTSHDRRTASAEDVMKHYVNNNFFNPKDKNRRFNNLQIAPNKNRGVKVEWESRYKNVAEELEEISLESGLGWHVYIDFESNQYVFDVYEKRDLTQDNAQGNNPVIFSPDFGTVRSQSFIDSDNDLRNYSYVAGQGEGVERKIISIGEDIGWERIETFVDARDLSDDMDEDDDRYVEEGEEDDNKITDKEYEALLLKRGNAKMKEMETLLSFEAEILTPVTRKSYEYNHEGYLTPARPIGNYVPKEQTITPFEYEKDFNLGDIVSVVNKSWGVDMKVPIIEINEIHEQGGFRLEAVFGEVRPTLVKKIQDKFDDINDNDKNEAVYKRIDYAKEEIKKEVAESIVFQNKTLWTGIASPTENNIITPEKTLKECRNGWLIQWQRYISGEGIIPQNYQYTYISKQSLNLGSDNNKGGYGHRIVLMYGTELVTKYIYIHTTIIEGYPENVQGDNRGLVISGVFEW